MKLKVCILAVTAVLAANAEDRQPPKKAATTKTVAPGAEVKIPTGATQIEPGTYTFTDAKGKKWIYRQTPFGIARAEDKPAEAAPVAAEVVITATEDGDTIRFERPGPFGPYRWQKKKSDLAADERAAWERSRAATTAAAKGKQD